jgi:rhodanese-related sulfurtransferase/predicted transcriptional regulator
MPKGDRPKAALFESIAVMGKAFASPRRLELLDLLAQGPRTVDQLAKASKQSVANASQHLQALHAAGLVSREREGNKVRYELAGEDVLKLWLDLRDTSGERLAEVERSARDFLGEEVEGIDRTELLKRMRRRDVVVIDVRPEDEYKAGHIEGARSIPIDELKERLDELPKGREVIAYCRGPFCVMANQAVRQLRNAGRSARRLDEGWPEWHLRELEKAGRR